MNTLTDTFGRTVTVSEDDSTYSFGGTTLTFGPGIDPQAALTTINGMAPEGWAPPPEPVTPAAILSAIEDLLDARAQSMGYRDKVDAVGYDNSAIPEFAAEAQAFKGYRDAVEGKAQTDLAAMQTGAMPVPETVAAYIATLPQP